jgi:hypothetical protein
VQTLQVQESRVRRGRAHDPGVLQDAVELMEATLLVGGQSARGRPVELDLRAPFRGGEPLRIGPDPMRPQRFGHPDEVGAHQNTARIQQERPDRFPIRQRESQGPSSS